MFQDLKEGDDILIDLCSEILKENVHILLEKVYSRDCVITKR